jgi:hypothetical protein
VFSFSLRRDLTSRNKKNLGYYSPFFASGVYYYCNYSLAPGAANCVAGNCSWGHYFNGTDCDEVPAHFYNPMNNTGVYYYCPYNMPPGAKACYFGAYSFLFMEYLKLIIFCFEMKRAV